MLNKTCNVVYFLLVMGVLLFLVGCSQTRQVLSPQQSVSLGFNVDSSSVLKNPQTNVARIYIFRSSSLLGARARYTLSMEWNANLSDNGGIKQANYQDSLGFMTRGTIFYVDVLPNVPIALSARTESSSYVYFTPQASKIYCLHTGTTQGFFINRPDLKLLNRSQCEQIYSALYYKSADSDDYQRRWRAKYVKQNKPSDLDGRVFWLSYMIQ